MAAAVPARWLCVEARLKSAHKWPTADCSVNVVLRSGVAAAAAADARLATPAATPMLKLELRIVLSTAD